MAASRTRAGLAWRMSSGTGARRSRLRYRKKPMIASGTTIDRIVRGWRQPLPERERGDLGRFVLEGLDQRSRFVVRDRGVERGCRLHRTRPYRTGLLVGPLTMVLPSLRPCRPSRHAGRSRRLRRRPARRGRCHAAD